MVDSALIEQSRRVWSDWKKAGRPYPMPALREYLTVAECAKEYGTYAATVAEGAKAVEVPILPGQVILTDFTCPGCGQPAPGYLEYGGTLVCSRECGALAAPDHYKFSPEFKARAQAQHEKRGRVRELEDQIAALRAELSGAGQPGEGK